MGNRLLHRPVCERTWDQTGRVLNDFTVHVSGSKILSGTRARITRLRQCERSKHAQHTLGTFYSNDEHAHTHTHTPPTSLKKNDCYILGLGDMTVQFLKELQNDEKQLVYFTCYRFVSFSVLNIMMYLFK